MMEATAAQPADAFRLQTCPYCEYSLAGHPASGVCPECGEAYDTGTVELVGTPQGTHISIANASPAEFRRKFLPWFILCPLLFAGWLWIVASGPAVQSYLLVLPMLLLLPWTDPAIRFLRRWNNGPTAVRVRLNRAGIVQDDDVDEPPAAAAWRVTMQAAGSFGFLLAMFWVNGLRWSWFWVPFIVGAIATPCIKAYRELRNRRRLWNSADGVRLTPAAKRWTLAPRRWFDVETVDIDARDGNVCRIVATSHAAAKQGRVGDVANIEVRCTTQQAAELQTRVRAWRSNARTAPRLNAIRAE